MNPRRVLSSGRRQPHETAGVTFALGGVTASQPEGGRSRDWEGKQRQDPEECVLTFRHQPRWIKELIAEIAEKKIVTRDEVARKLFEFALAEYQKGRLPMQSILQKGKLTLFPDEKE
jgi:hypothetical protein